jgi:hypothetical protein
VLQVSTKAVQPPHQDYIEASALGVSQHGVEGWSALLGPADAVIDMFDSGPAPRSGIPPQLGELILTGLIGGGHAGVDCGSHGFPPGQNHSRSLSRRQQIFEASTNISRIARPLIKPIFAGSRIVRLCEFSDVRFTLAGNMCLLRAYGP